MKILGAIIFWPMVVFLTIIHFITLALVALTLRIIHPSEAQFGAHWIACLWGSSVFALTPGWKRTVRGQEFLPKKRQATVIVANHQSMTDIWAIYTLRVQFRWLSKAEVFKIPLVGQAMQLAHYIPVKRGDHESHRKALEESARNLQNGVSMLFFPEGTRSKTNELLPFKLGAFKLALENKVPIVPIALAGTHDLIPKGSRIPSRAHVFIHILPQVLPNPGETAEQLASRVRGIISEELKKIASVPQ